MYELSGRVWSNTRNGDGEDDSLGIKIDLNFLHAESLNTVWRIAPESEG